MEADTNLCGKFGLTSCSACIYCSLIANQEFFQDAFKSISHYGFSF